MLPSKVKLSKLLGILYDAAAEPGLWDVFLEELAIGTGATSAGLLMHDFEHANYALFSSWRINPEMLRLYGDHYYALDIWAREGMGKTAGHVCTSQSLCAQTALKKSEIYGDFMMKAGIEHGMFGVLENSKSLLASVSLYRSRRCAEFTETELKVVEFLTPHVQRAFGLHRQFVELRARAAGFEAALEMVATPASLFGEGGKIVSMNRSALALTGERDGLVATREGLRAERAAESGLLARAIERASCLSRSNGDRAGETVWISRRKGGPLQLLISPVGNNGFQGNGSVTAIAFVNDASRRQRPAEDTLRIRFGLTRAESRVALLLCDGRAPRNIAETIGVSVETVRSQMKSIYAKTEVRRQSELVRLLLSNAAPVTLGRSKP